MRFVVASLSLAMIACGSKSGLGLPVDDRAPESALSAATPAAVVVPPDDGVPDDPNADLVFTVPFGAAPSPVKGRVSHPIVVRDVDLAITIDSTGSMAKPIAALTDGIAGVMASLQAVFPTVGLAVVDFRDVGDPWVVKVRSTITTDVGAAQTALQAMVADGGGDEPEADLQAIYYAITGAPVSSLAAHVAPRGRFGGVDFRFGALPVVANVTDARFHDPSGKIDASTVAAALAAMHARFVAITETRFSADHPDLERVAEALSDATSSHVPLDAFRGACGDGMCCTGVGGVGEPPRGPDGSCRLDFHSLEGVGVGASLVDGLRALAIGTRFDVIAVPVDAPGDAIDAASLVTAVRAVDEGDPSRGCAPRPAEDRDGDGVRETFVDAPVGVPLCFEVVVASNHLSSRAGSYDVFLDVLGLPGSILLDRRRVRFVVPS